MTINIYNTYLYIFLTVIAFISTACAKDEPLPEPKPERCRRTVLVYQVANNNLGISGYNEMDIKEMRQGAANGYIPDDCRFLVYNAGPYNDPLLLEICKDGVDTLKVYNSDILSVSSQRMYEVFDDVNTFAPSEELGLILWSHGSGWVQDGMADDADYASPLSFGSERGKTMNVTTLANVLSNIQQLSFLYFDCCYMASVETLYELKDVAPVIVASATELLVYGMPYDENMSCFFSDDEALVGAARNTFALYDSMQGSSRTCTMSVVKTEGLSYLSDICAEIFSQASAALPSSYRPQRFMARDYSSCLYFDMEDYIKVLCLGTDGSEQFEGAEALFAKYQDAMASCIKYKASTPRLWNEIDIEHHCGMSTYIIDDEQKLSNKNYTSLKWYGDVVSKLKF